MALPSTLPAEAFADLFHVQDWQFSQGVQQQRSATGGGETRYADRGPTLFKVEATTAVLDNAEAEGVMALINSRAGGLKTVLLYNKRLPFPPSDPDGTKLGAATPKLGVITDRLHIAFTGFPPGYVIPLGTYFGIIFDDSRYYLGQFAEAKVANPITGTVGATEVWPPLPAGITGTPDIVLQKACAKFRLTPNSAYPSTQGALHATIKFSAEQTYSR